MMGKTIFLGEFASNFSNRFELAPESDNPHFFGPQKMEPSDYLLSTLLLLVSWTVHTIKIISLLEVNQALIAWSYIS